MPHDNDDIELFDAEKPHASGAAPQPPTLADEMEAISDSLLLDLGLEPDDPKHRVVVMKQLKWLAALAAPASGKLREALTIYDEYYALVEHMKGEVKTLQTLSERLANGGENHRSDIVLARANEISGCISRFSAVFRKVRAALAAADESPITYTKDGEPLGPDPLQREMS